MKQKVAVVNVRLPDELIAWIDELVKENIYSSRSEAIRDFSREYTLKNREAS